MTPSTFLGRGVCLGKGPAKTDPRTLRMARYLVANQLPTPPLVRRWSSAVSQFPMLLNDRIGDCTIVGLSHAELTWTSNNGKPWCPSEAAVLEAYQHVGGYVPGVPETDSGAAMLDALTYFRKVGIGGRKIDAFVALNPKKWSEFKTAIDMFGGVYLGLNLPESAGRQSTWRVSLAGTDGNSAPGTWGGHAVFAVDYSDMGDDDDGLWVATWGGLQKLTKRWLKAYCDEAYAMLSKDWADADGAPSGFDYERLRVDLAKVAA